MQKHWQSRDTSVILIEEENMEVFIVVAIVWIISEIIKEQWQGSIYDKNANELRETLRQIDKNFQNKK